MDTQSPSPSVQIPSVSPSGIALIAANLIPFIGIAFWGWKLEDILFLYWSESAIIGFFNLLKIAFAQGDTAPAWAVAVTKLFMSAFFIVHFGIFMTVHGIFLYLFMRGNPDTLTQAIFFSFVYKVRYALLALVISHGVSFYLNYVHRAEYLRAKLPEIMAQPYHRIMIMHFTILLGAFLAAILRDNIAFLFVMIAVKSVFDYTAHKKERRRFENPPQPEIPVQQ